MCFEPRDYLRHILAEADYLMNQCAGLTADRFMADETLQSAFIRSLEIEHGRISAYLWPLFPGRPAFCSLANVLHRERVPEFASLNSPTFHRAMAKANYNVTCSANHVQQPHPPDELPGRCVHSQSRQRLALPPLT